MRHPLPRWLDRLETAYYNVYYGVQNLVRWFPVVWAWRPWDHAHLLGVMETATAQMAQYQKQHGWHVGSERHARQLRVVAELCRRLGEDNMEEHVETEWPDTYFNWPEWRQRRLGERIMAAEKWSEQYLGTLIAKHLRTWWD